MKYNDTAFNDFETRGRSLEGCEERINRQRHGASRIREHGTKEGVEDEIEMNGVLIVFFIACAAIFLVIVVADRERTEWRRVE